MAKFQTKYQARGLEILAFPCGQFGDQEFAEENEIVKFLHENYGITVGDGFRLMKKVKKNGFLTLKKWSK